MNRTELRKKYTNQQLKDLIRQEDPDAIQYIYYRYFEMVNVQVANLGGTKEDVEDVFQDAMEDIVIQFRSSSFELKNSFQSYLYIICRNKWIDRLREMSSEKTYHAKRLEDSTDSDVGEKMDERGIDDVFQECFTKLGQMCRTILNLTWEQYSNKEISKMIDYAFEAVKKKRVRCRMQLIEEIKKDPYVVCMLKDKEGQKE